MTENRVKYCGLCSYFNIGEWNAEKVDEIYCNMVKKSLDVTIGVVDEYIKFWSDDDVQEFYYDVSPIEVLEELKTTLITGEYPTKMVKE